MQPLPIDPAAAPSVPQYDVDLTEGVKVAARDGVLLSTDVYMPGAAGSPYEVLCPRSSNGPLTTRPKSSCHRGTRTGSPDEDTRSLFRIAADVSNPAGT